MYIVFRALMSVSVYALTARGGFLSDDSANRVSTLLRRRHRCGQIHSMLDLLKSADFLFSQDTTRMLIVLLPPVRKQL